MPCTRTAQFEWTRQRSQAAVALAEGKTQEEVAAEVKASRRTICNWLCEPEFAAEVDRLSLMVNVASRAERLRLAMRVVREKLKSGKPQTDKDLLEWLKFAQSETDGVKLDLTALAAAFGKDDSSMALGGQAGVGSEPEDEAIH